MKYNKNSLFRAVTTIVPSYEACLQKEMITMPIACRLAAEECFTIQRPEDEHTAILRQALQDLSKGQFNYTPEQDMQ